MWRLCCWNTKDLRICGAESSDSARISLVGMIMREKMRKSKTFVATFMSVESYVMMTIKMMRMAVVVVMMMVMMTMMMALLVMVVMVAVMIITSFATPLM